MIDFITAKLPPKCVEDELVSTVLAGRLNILSLTVAWAIDPNRRVVWLGPNPSV